MIIKDGYPFLITTLILSIVIAFLLTPWFLIVGVCFLLFFANFFRDPERSIPTGKDMVSPADGKVIKVVNIDNNDGYTYFLSIFMSVYDAHINRAPIEGKITNYEYFKGKFKPAFDDKASVENERNLITIENAAIRLKMSQIAGILARRIVFWKKIGDHVGRGEKIGLIKFGSRVDIWLPKEFVPIVKEGQHVKAGTTIIASFKGLK